MFVLLCGVGSLDLRIPPDTRARDGETAT